MFAREYSIKKAKPQLCKRFWIQPIRNVYGGPGLIISGRLSVTS